MSPRLYPFLYLSSAPFASIMIARHSVLPGRLLLAILFTLASAISNGQKYGHVWHFGLKAGIDFNHCPPKPILNGRNAGGEGCASVCDANGQLLFYTNSDTVWNSQHIPMGSLVNSFGTLSQVLIVRQPQSQTIY